MSDEEGGFGMRRLCSVLVMSCWVAAGCAPAGSAAVDGPATGKLPGANGGAQAGESTRPPVAGTGSPGGAAGARSTGRAPSSEAGRAAAGVGAVAAGAPGAGAAGAVGAVGGPAAQSDGSLFPIKTGNSWTFRTTKGTELGEKTQTVGELQKVGGDGPMSGVMAYLMVTTKDDGMDKTESWQAEVEGKIIRYRERSYAAADGQLELEEYWDPYKLRVDGTQLTVGSTYTEEYNETKVMAGAAPMTAVSSDAWRVVAVDEMVTVPAGTFSAVVIEKIGGTSTKRYWFARGVGKVKEQSGAQLEELTSYKVMP
jgi:hypothetical protein